MDTPVFEALAGRPDTWPPDVFAPDPYLLAAEPRPSGDTSIVGRPETWPADAFEDDPYIPAPGISELVPPLAAVSDPPFTLTINGSGFGPDSVVEFNGMERPTDYVSAAQVTANVDPSLGTAGPVSVRIVSATGLPSPPVTFTLNPAVPPPL